MLIVWKNINFFTAQTNLSSPKKGMLYKLDWVVLKNKSMHNYIVQNQRQLLDTVGMMPDSMTGKQKQKSMEC